MMFAFDTTLAAQSAAGAPGTPHAPRPSRPRVIPPVARRRSAGLLLDCLRIVLTDLLQVVYRLHATGLDNIPDRGAALLVHNHVTVIDWLFVAVACPRVPRFVMHVRDYDRRGLRWFFDAFGVIPIAPYKEDPALLARANAAIDAALAAGDLVALCPEGIMTPDGELSPFREGATRIVQRCSVPVVPLALTGLWGSVFSRKDGRPLRRVSRGGRASVGIVVGPAITPKQVTTPYLVEMIALLRGGRR